MDCVHASTMFRDSMSPRTEGAQGEKELRYVKGSAKNGSGSCWGCWRSTDGILVDGVCLGGGVGKYQFNKTSYVKVTDGDVVQGLNSLWRMQSSSQGHDVRQGLEMRHIYTATKCVNRQVFMQLVAGEWAGQLLGMHGELITASKYSPAVFQLRTIHDEQKKDVCPETPAIPEPLAQDTNGSVSTVREGVSTWALQRASAIPRCIAPLNVDIVISCEAFCSSAQEKLVSKTKSQGFIYATKVVGDASLLGSKKAIDGGCFAMSKEMTFGTVASSDDRYAD
ncbi:unnamed protein product [Peronospora belbahrii]|uniref:Uncharacterized protein n=1 Tax=Peronospora belbahrii TaxID=622444 RepID=A0ABN8CMF8_9STRA|nr:unnamed protein product [Peronospora belbahrii]